MRETIDVDGFQLGPNTDYLAVVREQLKDGTVWPSDSGPEEGLWHAINATKGTGVRRQLLDAVARLLTDPDVEVRTRAIVMAQNYAPHIAAAAILSAVNTHPELFEGVKPQGASESYMPDLYWGILQALNADPKGPEVTSILRKAAEDPINGFRVMGGLAAADPTWVIARASTLVSGQPVRAKIILANLKGPERRERFVRALSGEPAEFRGQLATEIQEVVQSAEERHRLLTLLAA